MSEQELRAAINEALEREPTLDEVVEYGMDDERGGLFNTLQWRLDLIRDLVVESHP